MYRPMSSQQLERKIDRALRGDFDTFADLVEQVNTWSRISNQRMSRLEKAGLDIMTYNRAEQASRELGSTKFRPWEVDVAAEDIEDFIFQARETRLFLSKEESTVGGAKRRVNDLLDTMDRNDWLNKNAISEDTGISIARLMSGGLKDLITAFYENAEDIIENVVDRLEKGEDYENVARIISEVTTGGREYEDVFGVL